MASYLYFFCTHCRARNAWPANCVGKPLVCPICQQSFVDDDPYWPEDEPQPKKLPGHLQAFEVEEENSATTHTFIRGRRQQQEPVRTGTHETSSRSRRGAKRSRRKTSQSESVEYTLTDDLQPLYNAPGLQEMHPLRRSLYCLLIKTFQRYTGNRTDFIIAVILAPFFFVASAGIFLFVMGIFYYLSYLFGCCLDSWRNTILLIFPLMVVLMSIFLIPTHQASTTSLVFQQNGKAGYFHLGKMGDVLDPVGTAILGVNFGVCVAAQIGFLYFLNNPLSSGQAFDLREALLIAFDNLLHGVFLGAFESFNIRFTTPVQHTWFSAIWFFLFRLAFDSIVLLLILQIFRRASLRSLINRYPPLLKLVQYPATPVHVAQLTEWMDSVCQHQQGWLSTFPDELIFLALASEYLKGNDSAVQEIARKFSGAKISTDVKLMFGNESGEVLFSTVN